jgi:hypothetical protein
MLGPKILSGILIVLPATILLTAQSGFGASTSGECRASPGASAPAGLHWYYRVDHANNRHCWFLHSDGMQISARGDVLSLKPRDENGAKQARETTPTHSGTKQIAPPQLETAPPARDETPFPTPSLPEHIAIDFAAPGRYLPKSVDLDARELATGSNGDVAENEVTEAEEQMPSLRQNSAGVVVNGQWVEIVSPDEVNSIDAETPSLEQADVRSAPLTTRANVTSLAQALSLISGALAGLSVGLFLIRRSSESVKATQSPARSAARALCRSGSARYIAPGASHLW